MRKLLYILFLTPLIGFTQIDSISANLTAQDYTKDIRFRLTDSIPYPDNVPFVLLPLEPYVKVKQLDTIYTNYRAFKVDSFWICPIAKYVNGNRSHYTTFDECWQWAKIYGIDNIYVGIISKLKNNEEE